MINRSMALSVEYAWGHPAPMTRGQRRGDIQQRLQCNDTTARMQKNGVMRMRGKRGKRGGLDTRKRDTSRLEVFDGKKENLG